MTDSLIVHVYLQYWWRYSRLNHLPLHWILYNSMNSCPIRLMNPLKLHRGLPKARSSIAVQLRSGKTGLAHFLHWRVQDIPHLFLPARPKHIMVHCPRYAEAHINGQVDLKQTMTSPEGILKASAWWLKQNVLPLFQLTLELEKHNL